MRNRSRKCEPRKQAVTVSPKWVRSESPSLAYFIKIPYNGNNNVSSHVQLFPRCRERFPDVCRYCCGKSHEIRSNEVLCLIKKCSKRHDTAHMYVICRYLPYGVQGRIMVIFPSFRRLRRTLSLAPSEIPARPLCRSGNYRKLIYGFILLFSIRLIRAGQSIVVRPCWIMLIVVLRSGKNC